MQARSPHSAQVGVLVKLNLPASARISMTPYLVGAMAIEFKITIAENVPLALDLELAKPDLRTKSEFCMR